MANIIKYRLLTRSDLDGLICAVLMKHLDMLDEIMLIDHPSVMQERSVNVSNRDITTNLPYVPGVHLCIDHHFSESLRNEKNKNHIIDPDAPSAARVVYNYYGGSQRFPALFNDMMEGVDKADSGQFTIDEILSPTRWALLNFIVDQRTGIENYKEYTISEQQFKLDLIDLCGHLTIDKILELPDLKERSIVYFDNESGYKNQLETFATTCDNIVVVDLRNKTITHPGNRFIVYALFPQCNISVLIRRDDQTDKTSFSVGKSIVNLTSDVNIGEIMLSYGGGGHRAAGACHMDSHLAESALIKLLEALSDKK